jgi:poly(beta-D-mannuronate) lyase
MRQLLLACLVSGSSLATDLHAVSPSERLELDSWKLTLPVDTPAKGIPDEISPAELAGFVDARHFFVDPEGRVVFRAYCDGVTTKGSGYPRSELREISGGRAASWDTSGDRVRVMEATLSVTVLPRHKPHVVCAQIHDADRDVLMVRMEGRKLLVEREGLPDVVLATDQPLGKPFDLRIEAGRGQVKVWYEGRQALDWQVAAKGCYFKAGCYVQSNLLKGESPESFGEVRVSGLRLR